MSKKNDKVRLEYRRQIGERVVDLAIEVSARSASAEDIMLAAELGVNILKSWDAETSSE